MADDRRATTASPGPAGPARPVSGYRAMVVEDEPQLAALVTSYLERDGFEVCRLVRTFSDAYVVMLTARSDEVDTLIGLSVGADDYVTKPFSPRELMARIQAMLRRPRSPRRPAGEENDVRTFGCWRSTRRPGRCG